jgi:hypothetical protein
MTQPFVAVPTGMTAFTAANEMASTEITAAGSADSMAMLFAVAAALGPIGTPFTVAYGPAQAANLAGVLRVGAVHAAIGAGTDASQAAIVAADGA